MKRFLSTIILVVISLNVGAKSIEFKYTFEAGGLDPATIDLKTVVGAKPEETWFFASSCKDHADGVEPDKVFECSLDGKDKSKLNIKLFKEKMGAGKIAVRAVKQKGKEIEYVQDINYFIKVNPPKAEGSVGCIELNCSYYTGFYLGVEGTSVENINEKGGMRIQYSGYSHFGLNEDYWFNGVDIYGDLMQTNLQEQASIESSCKADSEDKEKKCKIKSTVAASFGVFAPTWGDENDEKQVGPSLEYLGQKLSGDDEFAKSYYGGFRLSYSKIRHFSIAYGKTEGIPGHRVKFSGQLPIAADKLLAGFTLNVASDDTAEELGVSSGDSVSIYIITQVDFTKIFPKLSQ